MRCRGRAGDSARWDAGGAVAARQPYQTCGLGNVGTARCAVRRTVQGRNRGRPRGDARSWVRRGFRPLGRGRGGRSATALPKGGKLVSTFGVASGFLFCHTFVTTDVQLFMPMRTVLALAVVATFAAAPALQAQKKIDFAKEIHPIFKESCYKCHGPEKQKGKLRLDSREAALKGGKDGPAFIPGDAAKSELYRRVTLPKSSDDVMPNEGEPLTKAQTDLIRDWINQGAVWGETGPAVTQQSEGAAELAGLPADFKPGAAEAKAIAGFAKAGVDIRPIAMNSPWREASFRALGTGVTDTVIIPIKDVASVIDLNLASTRITDAGLASVKNLTNLTRLHLENTGVGVAGLANLRGLVHLRYLNLYGTKVTDAGLAQLKSMKDLRHVYVWQTPVTTNGVESLKKLLPTAIIDTGWDLASLTNKMEQAEVKKADDKKPAEKKTVPDKEKEKK
jgi:hypothetical protein